MVLPPFPSQRFLRSLASVVDEPLPDLPAWLKKVVMTWG